VSGERLAAWVSRLVQIPSVTPHQAGPRAGVPGEAALAAAVATWFGDLGGQVTVEEVLTGRPNVYAIWPGRSSRWLAVDAHLDTVGVEQLAAADPFSGAIQDGRVWGRGAVDTKGSLGIILALLEAMHGRGQLPAANLLIGATMDEEVYATGAPAFAAWISRQGIAVDEMLVAEPTRCRPVVGHKGVLRVEFDVAGLAAHSSQPEAGRNAIAAAAELTLALVREHETLCARPVGPVGRPALTVTMVRGGSGTNIVPDRCTLSVDRRLVPGVPAAQVEAELMALAQKNCPLPVTMHRRLLLNAFWQTPEAAFVRHMEEWSGLTPASVPFGTNAWAYPNVARACLVMGPGSIDQAHGPEEWVEVAELEKMAAIYARWWGLV
jgi:acetylornithine deacetylase/succinyl-diaminopimelate desuccinylase-like protein